MRPDRHSISAIVIALIFCEGKRRGGGEKKWIDAIITPSGIKHGSDRDKKFM